MLTIMENRELQSILFNAGECVGVGVGVGEQMEAWKRLALLVVCHRKVRGYLVRVILM